MTEPRKKKRTLLIALNDLDVQDFINRYPRYHFDDLTIVKLEESPEGKGRKVDRVIFTPAVQERVPSFKQAMMAHLPAAP